MQYFKWYIYDYDCIFQYSIENRSWLPLCNIVSSYVLNSLLNNHHSSNEEPTIWLKKYRKCHWPKGNTSKVCGIFPLSIFEEFQYGETVNSKLCSQLLLLRGIHLGQSNIACLILQDSSCLGIFWLQSTAVTAPWGVLRNQKSEASAKAKSPQR